MTMKKITVMWVKTQDEKMYDKEMRVVYSDHKRFTKGTRFDFGFLSIASDEGYVIEILP
jgi:hypothetical protein